MKLLAAGLVCAYLCPVAAGQWAYPPTWTVEAEDTYFGVTYRDPYRWMEGLNDHEVKQWFRQQADLTDGVLAKIHGRQALVDEWTALDKLKPAAYGAVTVKNGRYFYKKTAGGEDVGKLYFRQGIDGPEKLLFDPTLYSKDQKTVIRSATPSWDGRHVVLALSSGGAEWSELRVLFVGNGKLLDERIYPSWGGDGLIVWTADNRSFFYDSGKVNDIKSSEIELNRKSRLHRLGTPVSDDLDFLSNESCRDLGILPAEWPATSISEDAAEWVIGAVGTVQREMRYYVTPASALKQGRAQWKTAARLSDNVVDCVAHGQWLYGLTHTDAPKYKVVRTPLEAPDWAHAQTVLPEAADALKSIARTSRHLFGVYSDGINDRMVGYDFETGKVSEVSLPQRGSIEVNCPDLKADVCEVTITSWTRPPSRYDYDASAGTFGRSRFDSGVVYPKFEELVAEEVEAPSHDGVMVPLSIIHTRDLKPDGSNCCILTGYGAYGISARPEFDIMSSVALHGVVLAIAHPRGGGEKGDAWYKAGYKATKPNTWKDFISCAEYLVRKGYTRPERLGGIGTSAGGILISRAITERPDLFRAAVCNVGCANAMRMEYSANGPVNVPEFGTVHDQSECRALFEMDGVQHVVKGVAYPAMMGVAGWNDPRVAPWQPGKFVAALQNASTSGRPVLLKVNYDSGHFTEEKSVTFKNVAGQYAFLLWQCGHEEFQTGK